MDARELVLPIACLLAVPRAAGAEIGSVAQYSQQRSSA